MCEGPHDFIPATNTAKLEMRYTVLGVQAMNVCYFQKSTDWTLANLTDLANEAQVRWVAHLFSLQHTSVTLVSCVATNVEVEDGQQFENPVGSAGGRAGNPMPNNVTLAISFRTGFTGRSRRGRLYHIGLVEGDVVDNAVSPIVAAGILGGYGDFFTNLASDTSSTHVIVSYCNNGEWRTNALVTPVESYTLTDTTVDTMRKRLS